MLCKRLAGIILLALLFAHQVLVMTRKDVASEQKALVDGIISSVMSKKIGVGGRKLMENPELMRKETSLMREGPINNGGGSEYSKISGKDSKASADDDSLGSPQEKLNTQDIAIVLEPIQTLKSVSLGISRNMTNTNNKQYHYSHDEDSKEEQPSLDSSSSRSAADMIINEEEITQKDETRSLLEAAKEIVNLMNKDYKGMGRRKPPINNQEPRH